MLLPIKKRIIDVCGQPSRNLGKNPRVGKVFTIGIQITHLK